MASDSDSLIALVYCRDILTPGTARVNDGPGYPQSVQTIQRSHGRPSDLCCPPSFDKRPLFFSLGTQMPCRVSVSTLHTNTT